MAWQKSLVPIENLALAERISSSENPGGGVHCRGRRVGGIKVWDHRPVGSYSRRVHQENKRDRVGPPLLLVIGASQKLT